MWYKMVPEIKSRVEGTCTHELVVPVSTTFRPLGSLSVACTYVPGAQPYHHPHQKEGQVLWFEARTPKMTSPYSPSTFTNDLDSIIC